MVVEKNIVYARFMGDGERAGYRRGLVYKIEVVEMKFSFFEKISHLYTGAPCIVEVERILSTGIRKWRLKYMSTKEYDNDWRVERNKYFKNVWKKESK